MILSVFRKSFREQVRSPWELALVLLLGPTFVLLYWLFFGGGSTSYPLLVLNADSGPRGAELVESFGALAYANGQTILRITPVADRASANAALRDRQAAALLVIPPGFSSALDDFRASGSPPEPGDLASAVVFAGDLTNPSYAVAAALTNAVLEEYLRAVAGQPRPVAVFEEALGGSAARTEFEIYVPGLLVVSVVMMIYSAAMRITRDVETGGIRRLALTRVTPFRYLAGVSLVQMLVGLASVLLTFLSALALGFHSQGSLWLAILVGILSSISVIGMGLLVAAFSRTTVEAFIIANFPMVLLMFFSGGIFPLPPIRLFTLAGRSFALFDLIPQTHAVLALNKVLTLGASLESVAYELIAVVVLSALYFLAGVWAFGVRVLKT